MENVILIVHLILALGLIGVVLLQRSEGGGLGIGGGGGGATTGRPAASPLGKFTWGLAIAFIITSMTLTILARTEAGSNSVLDALGTGAVTDEADPGALLPPAESLLPPATDLDQPLLPGSGN